MRGRRFPAQPVLAAWLLALLCFWAAGPAGASAPPERDYWPTQGWRISTPEAQGMDTGRLLKVIPFIIEKKLEIRSLLVIRNGCLVFENYYAQAMPDRAETIHSVTKSLTSALVGIARGQGFLPDLKATLPRFFPEYFKPGIEPGKRAINLEHLLTMTAGLQPVRVRDRLLSRQWYLAPDRVRFTLDLPLVHPPGQVFAYSNPLSDLLAIILTRQTGRRLLDLAKEHLFNPLGLKAELWSQDVQGYYNGHGGLHLTPRQMAKFGFLYLNQGLWEGRRIVPAEWVRTSTQARVRAGEHYDYGYQWWVRPVGGCPSFRAWGHGGQFIVVVPDLDLVVVVTSETKLRGRSSAHYSPLFDLVAGAVVDKGRRRGGGEEGPPDKAAPPGSPGLAGPVRP